MNIVTLLTRGTAQHWNWKMLALKKNLDAAFVTRVCVFLQDGASLDVRHSKLTVIRCEGSVTVSEAYAWAAYNLTGACAFADEGVFLSEGACSLSTDGVAHVLSPWWVDERGNIEFSGGGDYLSCLVCALPVAGLSECAARFGTTCCVGAAAYSLEAAGVRVENLGYYAKSFAPRALKSAMSACEDSAWLRVEPRLSDDAETVKELVRVRKTAAVVDASAPPSKSIQRTPTPPKAFATVFVLQSSALSSGVSEAVYNVTLNKNMVNPHVREVRVVTDAVHNPKVQNSKLSVSRLGPSLSANDVMELANSDLPHGSLVAVVPAGVYFDQSLSSADSVEAGQMLALNAWNVGADGKTSFDNAGHRFVGVVFRTPVWCGYSGRLQLDTLESVNRLVWESFNSGGVAVCNPSYTVKAFVYGNPQLAGQVQRQHIRLVACKKLEFGGHMVSENASAREAPPLPPPTFDKAPPVVGHWDALEDVLSLEACRPSGTTAPPGWEEAVTERPEEVSVDLRGATLSPEAMEALSWAARKYGSAVTEGGCLDWAPGLRPEPAEWAGTARCWDSGLGPATVRCVGVREMSRAEFRAAHRKRVVLLTQWYVSRSPSRNREIDECLSRNCACRSFDGVVVFVTGADEPPTHEKMTVVRLSARLTYDVAFAYASERLRGDVCCLANSDIYFDSEGVESLREHVGDDSFFALSRWDVRPDGSVSHYSHETSQDAWAFVSPIEQMCPSVLGIPGCDNRVAHEAWRRGLDVVNPSKTVRAYHVHSSGYRTYTSDRELGEYTFVAPAAMGEAPSYKHMTNNRTKKAGHGGLARSARKNTR